jgi:hypothetical protein
VSVANWLCARVSLRRSRNIKAKLYPHFTGRLRPDALGFGLSNGHSVLERRSVQLGFSSALIILSIASSSAFIALASSLASS